MSFFFSDPCLRMYDGQYILNHEFKKLFPYVDNMCYFVKCANKKAYLNPCGPATRNDKHGDGFCSHLDLEVSRGIRSSWVRSNNTQTYKHTPYNQVIIPSPNLELQCAFKHVRLVLIDKDAARPKSGRHELWLPVLLGETGSFPTVYGMPI